MEMWKMMKLIATLMAAMAMLAKIAMMDVNAVLVMSRTCYLRAAIRLVILLKPVIFRLQTMEILLVKAWSRMRMLKM